MNNVRAQLWALLTRREFGKFLLVGLANTAVSYLVYLGLNLFLSYTLAYTLGYLAGFILSYFLNSLWVFKTEPSWKTFLSYPLVYAAQFLINLVCLRLLVEKFSLSETVAPLVVIVLSIPITFVLSRFFLRRQNGNPA